VYKTVYVCLVWAVTMFQTIAANVVLGLIISIWCFELNQMLHRISEIYYLLCSWMVYLFASQSDQLLVDWLDVSWMW